MGCSFGVSLSTFENVAQPDAAGVRSAVFFHASTGARDLRIDSPGILSSMR
jgi:hypothetical protein